MGKARREGRIHATGSKLKNGKCGQYKPPHQPPIESPTGPKWIIDPAVPLPTPNLPTGDHRHWPLDNQLERVEFDHQAVVANLTLKKRFFLFVWNGFEDLNA